jgi:hypothetical protein
MTEHAAATPRTVEITIHAGALSPDEFLARLKSKCEGQPVTFHLHREPVAFRHIDAAVLVAIVAAGGVVARTFLKGVFDFASEKRKQTITIKGIRDGKEFQLVVPVTASDDEIERVIALWQVMARSHIELSDGSPLPR